MNGKRLLLYLLLNAVVSAAATLTVLWVWDRTHPSPGGAPALTLTATPPSLPVAAATQPTAGPTAVSPELPTPTRYIVKSGDSLGSIATEFDVSIDDIMAANNLTNPNIISVGATLIIPVAGSVPPTAEPATAGPAATTVIEPPRPTTTANPSAAQPQLIIREVVGAGVLAEERLVIFNQGGPVDLAGWRLTGAGGAAYTFPALMLFEGGAVAVHTAAGVDSVTDLFWGQAEPVWASGQAATLSDAAGSTHARFTIP